jgi:hypothetical protein
MKRKTKIIYLFSLTILAVGLFLNFRVAFVQAQTKTNPTTNQPSSTTTKPNPSIDDVKSGSPSGSAGLFGSGAGLVNCGRNNDLLNRAGNPADNSHACTLYDLFSMFARVINFLLAVAGFFAVFQIIRAGQSMVLAMGNPESLTVAKNSLRNAVLGFALVLIAYVLMYAIVYGFLGVKENPFNLFCFLFIILLMVVRNM